MIAFDLLQLSLEMARFRISTLNRFDFLDCIVIFSEETLSFIIDEIAKNLKGILLFNLFSFKELCNFSNTGSNVFNFFFFGRDFFLQRDYFLKRIF